jgi:hypothetical protein
MLFKMKGLANSSQPFYFKLIFACQTQFILEKFEHEIYRRLLSI